MSVLLITHDLGVVAETAQDVAVMYASRIVEKGGVLDIFRNASHPYTKALFKSMPGFSENEGRLHSIPGRVPEPRCFPPGCKFHPRCEHAFPRCREEEPPFMKVKEGHGSACWLSAGKGDEE
jgi:oligopeptide/dipeptide ABC transporter ATP-binding protein